MENNIRLILRAQEAGKSLRWLANNFDAPEYPEDDAGRLAQCIQVYCSRGADTIEELILALQRQAIEEAIGE